MAEDQVKNEPSGLAPGPEVPDEERFLSTEKQYPTKEARAKEIEEARRPVTPKLPHVPPFIEHRPSKPDWQPVPEPEPQPRSGDEAWAERVLARNRAERSTQTAQKPDIVAGESSTETKKPSTVTPYNPAEHIEAKGGAARLKMILGAPELVESTRLRFSSAHKAPSGSEILGPPERTFKKPPPFQPVPLSAKPPATGNALRQQIKNIPQKEPRQSFLGNLWNRIRGRS